MMRAHALSLAICLLPCGFAAGAESAPAEEGAPAEPLPYVEVTVAMPDGEYLANIDISGAEPMKVNGQELDMADHIPGAVRIARADGGSMADQAYSAREVLKAACATRGMRADQAVPPVLTPGGRWIFQGGCK
jgi:hypothetical protein